MVRLLRHRQTKGAATDRLYLRPPRHILTLPEKSVILVSHQPAVHRQLCDRLVWIEGGIVQEAGEVKTVLEKYLEYHK